MLLLARSSSTGSLCLAMLPAIPSRPLTQPSHPPPPDHRLGVREEAGHDAVLLMDRVMSTSLQLAPDLLDLLAVGCVVIGAKQVRAGRGMDAAQAAVAAGAEVAAAAAGHPCRLCCC